MTAPVSFIEPDRRRAMIADAAYFLAERRGFRLGSELDDWLMAEREVDQRLNGGHDENGCGT